MEAFVSRKRRRLSPATETSPPSRIAKNTKYAEEDEDSTDLKLAILASQNPETDQATLLDLLVTAHGSVQDVRDLLNAPSQDITSPRRPSSKQIITGHQTSLTQYKSPNALTSSSSSKTPTPRPLTRKNQTLYLYSPTDIAHHTPCSIIHNFLPTATADALLRELLLETPSFSAQTFKLFDNVVTSPHTASFYVSSLEEASRQKEEYLYNGSYLSDVRELTPQMRAVKSKVQEVVNQEIEQRVKEVYPQGKRLQYQSSGEWVPNAAFVNCYEGGKESVGYHSDQLTYLGPRAVIGSLSLGVEREFRIRRVVPRAVDDVDDEDNGGEASPQAKRSSTDKIEDDNSNNPLVNHHADQKRKKASSSPAAATTATADAQGQISLPLPHNSLLIMHAEMQESWKHSIAPARTITPHPISGNKRINITYRHYRDEFHPRYTPRCRCGVATVLRCVQRKRGSVGRYMWMCQGGGVPEKGREGCGWFEWAEFDGEGRPRGWEGRRKGEGEDEEVVEDGEEGERENRRIEKAI